MEKALMLTEQGVQVVRGDQYAIPRRSFPLEKGGRRVGDHLFNPGRGIGRDRLPG